MEKNGGAHFQPVVGGHAPGHDGCSHIRVGRGRSGIGRRLSRYQILLSRLDIVSRSRAPSAKVAAELNFLCERACLGHTLCGATSREKGVDEQVGRSTISPTATLTPTAPTRLPCVTAFRASSESVHRSHSFIDGLPVNGLSRTLGHNKVSGSPPSQEMGYPGASKGLTLGQVTGRGTRVGPA